VISQPLPSGWQAALDLGFERRSTGTVLSHNLHKGPLQVQKALYPEGRDTCHVAVLHPPGGIAAGDCLSISARLQDGARALLTTPGATKWYRSDGEYARQQHHFSVGGDAVLEWLPRENIVFDGSNVSTSLDVGLSGSSKYFGWELMSFGRRASGERWRRGNLRMRTCIRRGGRMLWSEIAHLDAGGAFGESSVGLSGRTVCGTFVVAGEDVGSELLAACREVRRPLAEARCGITRLPGVLLARYLGDSTEEGFDWFTELWEVLRPALTARAACAPRVWAC
jgi:urease accessory protein